MASWLTSAIQTVRDKSTDALEFVRKDLTEFTTTVKTDTEVYLNKIKTQEIGDLGINQFVSKLSNSAKADNDDEKHFQASASYDRVHSELARLQNDESTYLTDPTPIEAYENWRQTTAFNVDTRKGEIAQLLIDAPHVRSFYANLVPAQTTHSDFWSRYYFRLHQIEEEEARRTQLLRRAHEICLENDENTETNNENDWDEPDEEWSKGPSNITQDSTPETVYIEHHKEQQASTPETVSVENHEEQQASAPETVAVEHHEKQQESVPETVAVEHHKKQQASTPETVAVEHHEEQQEPISVSASLEEANKERTGSDTVSSGDSWEREFDETDLVSSKPDVDPLTKSEETLTSESLSSSTTTVPLAASSSASSSAKKGNNEFDDEWEAWA